MRFTVKLLLASLLFFGQVRAQVIQNSHVIQARPLLDSARLFMEEDKPDMALKLVLNAQDVLFQNDTAVNQQQEALELTADAMANMGEYLQAIPALRKWLEIELEVNGKKTLAYYLQEGRIGSYYLLREEWENARREFLSARESALEVGIPRFIAGAENNLGILMSKIGKQDSALWYFQRAEGAIEFRVWRDSNLLARIRDNRAEIYAAQGQLDRALEIFYWEHGFFKGSVFPEKVALTGMRIAEINLERGHFNGMDKWLDSLGPYMVFDNRKEQLENQVRLEKLWIAYADSINNAALTARHSALGFEYLASLVEYNEKTQKSVQEALKAYRLRSFLKEQELEEAKVQQQHDRDRQEARIREILIGGISVAVVLVIVAMLYFAQRRAAYLALQKQMVETELRNKQLESQSLKHALQHKQRDLTDVSLNVALSKDYHSHVVNRLKEIAQHTNEGPSQELKALIQDMHARAATNEKLQIVTEKIDTVNSGFYNKLERNFPNLTKAEREICGLIRLNISGKEIAAMRNIHPDSVKKTRQRLRKKLGLSPEDDIYKFIQEL